MLKKRQSFFGFLSALLVLFSLTACSAGTAATTTTFAVSTTATTTTQETATEAASTSHAEPKTTTKKVPVSTAAPVSDTSLTVHFWNVGQGDSELVELPDGKCILIDAGEADKASTVIADVRKTGRDKIDYLLATHPHADHIGGMEAVVNAFSIGAVYMPKVSTNTKTFESLLTAIQKKGLTIKTAKAGVTLCSGNGFTAQFLAPVRASYPDLNNMSAVLKITYGQRSFLFMGDAQTASEGDITADVHADVIKVGHHGSTTSSGTAFTKKVKPQYAVISVGTGNSYGHPSDAIIKRWMDVGATVFRSDLCGTVTAVSDGTALKVSAELSATQVTRTVKKATTSSAVVNTAISKAPAPVTTSQAVSVSYVLNTSTKKIHLLSCRYVKQISTKNYATSEKSVAALEKEGYEPCKVCHPAD